MPVGCFGMSSVSSHKDQTAIATPGRAAKFDTGPGTFFWTHQMHEPSIFLGLSFRIGRLHLSDSTTKTRANFNKIPLSDESKTDLFDTALSRPVRTSVDVS